MRQAEAWKGQAKQVPSKWTVLDIFCQDFSQIFVCPTLGRLKCTQEHVLEIESFRESQERVFCLCFQFQGASETFHLFRKLNRQLLIWVYIRQTALAG